MREGLTVLVQEARQGLSRKGGHALHPMPLGRCWRHPHQHLPQQCVVEGFACRLKQNVMKTLCLLLPSCLSATTSYARLCDWCAGLPSVQSVSSTGRHKQQHQVSLLHSVAQQHHAMCAVMVCIKTPTLLPSGMHLEKNRESRGIAQRTAPAAFEVSSKVLVLPECA